MKNMINAQSLQEASTLAGQIEGLQTELAAAQAQVDTLTAQLSPLETKLNQLLGRPQRSYRKGRTMTDEQKANISRAQKERWAARKAQIPASEPAPAPAQ